MTSRPRAPRSTVSAAAASPRSTSPQRLVMSGMEDCVIAGGTEMMSYTAQIGAEEANAGIKPLGMGSGNPRSTRSTPRAIRACAVTRLPHGRHHRAALDALALESQRRADIAIKEGRFDKSVVTVYNEDGTVALDHEEFPRPETTAEGLASLKASFDALPISIWAAPPSASRSCANIRTWNSRASIMPATARAWSMAQLLSCSPSRAMPTRTA
jgi:acetyl-CoA acetyltransferase